MGTITLTPKRRLEIVIAIAIFVFLSEVIVGRLTRSLVLIADASHMISDIVAYSILWFFARLSERSTSSDSSLGRIESQDRPDHWYQRLNFRGRRADIVGAFFNGAFLIAIGTSVFLQGTERFVDRKIIENPRIVIAVGSTSLMANCLMALVCHESIGYRGPGSCESEEVCKSPKRHSSLTMRSAVLHILGDALNTLGVILVGLISYFDRSSNVAYADAIITMTIGLGIIVSSIPMTLRSSLILLQATPHSVALRAISTALLALPGVRSVENLRAWKLDETHIVASVQVRVIFPASQNHACLVATMSRSGMDAKSDEREVLTEPYTAVALHIVLLRRMRKIFQAFDIEDVAIEIDYLEE